MVVLKRVQTKGLPLVQWRGGVMGLLVSTHTHTQAHAGYR